MNARLWGIGIAALLAAGGLPSASWAQVPGSPATNGFQPIFKPRQKPEPPKQTAPALPGAQPGLGAAPRDSATTDMSPNDELFDAINRGDIASAKDAISRGADLRAENILGMTPLELSVDLSRNDITFLLLSFRDEGLPPPHSAVQTVSAPATSLTQSTKPANPRVAATKPRTHQPAANAIPVSRVYANQSDPGTPDPSAGFLGFGGTVR
jgi:hypothetical protein